MKLIILNGSPAAGKSTLAARLHQDLPMSLLADIDIWRKLIIGWRENREKSLELAYKSMVAAVDAYLQTGNSVLVDKAILSDNRILDALVEIGQKHNAEVYEFILTARKEVIIQRSAERGFHDDSLLTPERVIELWNIAQTLKPKRPNAILIDTSSIDPETLYKQVKRLVFS